MPYKYTNLSARWVSRWESQLVFGWKKTKQVTVSENKEDLKDRSIEDYCTVKEKPQTIEDKICPSNYFWLL